MKIFTRTSLLSLMFLIMVQFANAQVRITLTARIAPPVIPVYVQPPCPTVGYLWEPGYWDYSADVTDYYWVPGVWMAPPSAGLYWTPGYWGYDGTIYTFYTGYWGPHVGFYGGVRYGFGYEGVGFSGGEWRNGAFQYAVVNRMVAGNRPAFNGQGGIVAEPTKDELVAMNEHHIEPTRDQIAHRQAAMADGSSFSKLNNGRPVAAAMDKAKGTTFNTHGQASATTPAARVKAIGARAERNTATQETPAVRADEAASGQATEKAEKKEGQKEEKTEKVEKKEDQKTEKKEEQRSEKAQKQQRAKVVAPKTPVKAAEPKRVP